MTALIKYIVALILSLLMMSCVFNSKFMNGIEGNGEVVIKERPIESFNKIKVSRGLDVYLTQSNFEKLVVEADENLHDIIMTKVENNILHIYADENIESSKSKKVMVNFNDLNEISTASGSRLRGTNAFELENLLLESASGSTLDIDIKTQVLECESSSGSSLIVSGTTEKLYAESSSGSTIRAEDLLSQVGNVSASSGSTLRVNSSEELVASANSGASIRYSGNPEKLVKNSGVSGSISKN